MSEKGSRPNMGGSSSCADQLDGYSSDEACPAIEPAKLLNLPKKMIFYLLQIHDSPLTNQLGGNGSPPGREEIQPSQLDVFGGALLAIEQHFAHEQRLRHPPPNPQLTWSSLPQHHTVPSGASGAWAISERLGGLSESGSTSMMQIVRCS